MEFIYLIILGLALGIVLSLGYEFLLLKRIVKIKGVAIKGYKFHHSILGLILILLAFIVKINSVVNILLISIGVGIVFRHYLMGDGFKIITKIKK